MRIDVWSDIACPWCYIGKRRLETALEGFEHADEVEVVWRSFELDPGAPVPPVDRTSTHLSQKYGGGPDQIAAMQARVAGLAAEEGLDYRLDDTMHVSTRDAHRLLHLALETGGPQLQGALEEALLSRYFEQAQDVSSPALLRSVAVEAGLPADEVDAVLDSDRFDAEVSADIEQARALGADGVPFFVVDGRYGISGAQPVEVFAGALAQAWREAHPPLQTFGVAAGSGDTVPGDVADGACGPDGCELPAR